MVANANDRKLVQKQFQKHVNLIFEELGKAVSEREFDQFMQVMADNIKNLGARIKQMDKKIERRIKDNHGAALKDSLS